MALAPVLVQATSKDWSEWQHAVGKGDVIACCDCGLTHEFQFRIEGGKFYYRVRVSPRHTAAIRREKRKKRGRQAP